MPTARAHDAADRCSRSMTCHPFRCATQRRGGDASAGASRSAARRRGRLFDVGAGEMVALVGESGCGKTTTAQTVMRLAERARGSSRSTDQDITHSPPELRPTAARMQMIYQDPYESLDPRFRVRDTVAEPLVVHGIGSTQGRARPARHRGHGARRARSRPSSTSTASRTSSPVASASASRSRARIVLAHSCCRRRAGLDARCLGPRRDPVVARRSCAAGPRNPDDHPRPVGRRELRRPDRTSCTWGGSSSRARRGGRSADPRIPIHGTDRVAPRRADARSSGRSSPARHPTP